MLWLYVYLRIAGVLYNTSLVHISTRTESLLRTSESWIKKYAHSRKCKRQYSCKKFVFSFVFVFMKKWIIYLNVFKYLIARYREKFNSWSCIKFGRNVIEINNIFDWLVIHYYILNGIHVLVSDYCYQTNEYFAYFTYCFG